MVGDSLLYLLFLSLSKVIIYFSLSDSGEDGQTIEALKCKNTFNPVRQRVFQVWFVDSTFKFKLLNFSHAVKNA